MTAGGDRSDTDGSICVDCGLCCDGTYLVRGHIYPDQDSGTLALGKVEVVELGDKPYFKQPCPHFTGGGCSIYENRFTVCRTYRCRLLKQYEKGDVSFSEAKEAIATARSLVAAVAASDPEAAKSAARIRLRAELAELRNSVEPQKRAEIARRLLNIIALDEFMKSRFRGRDDPDASAGKKADGTGNPAASA